MESIFTEIYNKKAWGAHIDGRGSSGPGSRVDIVEPYIQFLQNFLKLNEIKSVVDVGCGDWQFAKHINWDGIDYTGIDIVGSVISYNKENYSSGNVHFVHTDFTKGVETEADVYIIKDVLQHVDNKSLDDFLSNTIRNKKARFIILVNCFADAKDNQDNLEIGQTRPLDARTFPLKKWNPVIFGYFFTKQISIITIPN